MGISRREQERHWRQQWEKLRADPSPHGLDELVRALLGAGERAFANEVLGFMESVFPDSEILRRLHAMLLTEQSEAELRSARARVRAGGGIADYLNLAHQYRKVSRPESCERVLLEVLKNHGEHPTALAWLGELRYERYRTTWSARDGQAAETYLRRSIDAEPEALKPRLLLAELLYQVGADAQARTELLALRERFPAHERAAELLAVLEEGARRESGASGGGEDLASCFLMCEERMGPLRELPWDAPPPVASRDEDLERAELERVQEVLRTDRTAFWRETPSAEAPILEREVAKLADFLERAVRGMDIGVPTGLSVECDDGTLVIELKRNARLAAVVPKAGPEVEWSTAIARDALERITRGA